MLIAPLLVLVMSPAAAISLSLPLLMFGDIFALYSYWKKWDMHYIRLLLPLAILGIIVGTYLLATLDSLTLRHLIGLFTLLFVVYKIADHWLKALDYQPRDWHGYLAGGIAGIGSALANAGSVPFTAYMLLQDVTPEVFVGNDHAVFCRPQSAESAELYHRRSVRLEHAAAGDLVAARYPGWGLPGALDHRADRQDRLRAHHAGRAGDRQHRSARFLKLFSSTVHSPP